MITITDVGPTPSSFPREPANNNHSNSGRINTLVLSADPTRLYAGSFAGVWRSDDSGQTWRQLTFPQPTLAVRGDIPGALYAPDIADMAASPADPNILLVSALDSQYADGRDGVYRTADGGTTWSMVLNFSSPWNLVFAPDDPQLVYAVTTQVTQGMPPRNFGVVAISKDAGVTWKTHSLGLNTSVWHIAVAPLEASGIRRVYTVGDMVVRYSEDGGQTWRVDAGVQHQINDVRSILAAFQMGCKGSGVGNFGGAISFAAGSAPQILAVEPGNPASVYMATSGGALGPCYYSDKVPDGTLVNTRCERLAGEASLWRGDFSRFDANNGKASWELLAGPPVYTFVTSPSGNCYVATKATTSGFLVFFSDNSHLHVSVGKPTDNSSWHRLDGMDASAAHRAGIGQNTLFMHADPHAIAFTPDFEITLKPSTENDPTYTKNSELDKHIAGRLWLANDGGVYFCDDGGKSESSWLMPSGLQTLDPVNIAGLFGIGNQPALYFGCGDDNDFFSRDGGQHWGDPGSGCGDCDCWFSDVDDVSRVYQFLPRRGVGTDFAGFIGIIKSDGSEYPNAGDNGAKLFVPSPKKVNFLDSSKLAPYASSDVFLFGYRPLILTLATEAALPDGDLIVIEQTLDGVAKLFRTVAISKISSVDDWHDPSKAVQIGPQLPGGAIVVQACGGHNNPVFYAADVNFPTNGNVNGSQIWKLSADKTIWNQIVPNQSPISPVSNALRWFVDPYDPNTIYVLDKDGVKLSVDGGLNWEFDARFTRVITLDGKLHISGSLLNDMLFLRGERQTRFAFGTAGVFWTDDFGVEWLPIVNSIALPGRPESGFFDAISDPNDHALYVECEGRSILRIGGIPGPPPFVAPPPFDLMEFAALEY